jgi:heptosyltransferase-2
MSGVVTAAPEPRRLLVVGPAWVGDMVMAQSLFITLRRLHPGCEIDVAAPAWSEPLLARMPEIRAAVPVPLGHGEFGWGKRRDIGRGLRDRRYHQAIVLPRSFKSALVPFHAGVGQRTGYRGETRLWLLNDIRPLDKSRLTQTVQRYVALGYGPDEPQPPPVPHPRLRVDEANQRRLCDELSLATDAPLTAMMPGAEYGPSKCWPLEYYAETARALLARGERVWVLGSAKDRPAAARIRELAGDGVTDLSGRTQLEDAVDLLALAGRAVTNDSGLMHVAAAVGCRLVAIYGSTTPDYTPPLSDQAEIVRLGLECSPCFERDCPLGHFRCMKDIRPEAVLERLTPPAAY